MADSVALVLAIVLVALAFDFINGIHDSANSSATVGSTRVLSPTTGVVWAACSSFAAVYLFGNAVAKTIAKAIVDPAMVDECVIVAGLVGGISRKLITWSEALPNSTSQALTGGYVGSAIAKAGAAELVL